MQKALTCVLMIAWSLWFGGMIALFLFVMRLFITNRDMATQAAPVLFQAFATYQIIVGMITCGCGTILLLSSRRKSLGISIALMLGSLTLSLVLRSWTIEMMHLNRSLAADVARFQTLHHSTTNLYTTSAILLFLAGIIGVIVMLPVSRRRSDETAAARDSLAEVAGRSPAA